MPRIPVRRVRWRQAFRIVPSRFPPVGPWDRIAPAVDFAALAEVEALTNPRLREQGGAIAIVPRERWLTGPGSTPVMAAFTHLNPQGSRFSDGSYGIFYASREIDTAVRETVHHREQFLARTAEPPLQLQMRCYRTSIDASLHDIRGGYRELHSPDDYLASQRCGRELRAANANGIVYDSVRAAGGHCAALFWPDCVAPCVQAQHFAYLWDGTRITAVLEMKAVTLQS
jgi:hypothetical protein